MHAPHAPMPRPAASRTFSVRSWTCQGRRRLTSWGSPPTCFASAFNTHVRPSLVHAFLLRVGVRYSRVSAALRIGRVRADSFDFAATGSVFQEARAIVRQVDEVRWALEIHRTSHPRDVPVDFARRLAEALDPRPE